MKLLRYGPPGDERPGLLDSFGAIRDLSDHVEDLDPIQIAAGTLAHVIDIDPASLPRVFGTPRLGPVISSTGKFIAIGLNYRDHADQLERGGTWDKGKGCDTFGPIGPWLVTPDELGDAQNLNVWLDVNGKRMQESNTKEMIFEVRVLLSYSGS
jgi:2-keto-4-pentenoate hydratase/2-oxohepta-3-ene-1,7-dioic acid hydratase in catechol pathway